MKPERMQEELAKIDGWIRRSNKLSGAVWYEKGAVVCKFNEFPHYLRSHDALQPLINGLYDSAQLAYDYHDEITEICSGDYLYVHTATCEQKAEAILKALGKWGQD